MLAMLHLIRLTPTARPKLEQSHEYVQHDHRPLTQSMSATQKCDLYAKSLMSTYWIRIAVPLLCPCSVSMPPKAAECRCTVMRQLAWSNVKRITYYRREQESFGHACVVNKCRRSARPQAQATCQNTKLIVDTGLLSSDGCG